MSSHPAPFERLRLVTPTPEHEAACQAMLAEFLEAGEAPFTNVELAFADFPAFARELDEEARGVGLPERVVPQQTYWLERDDGTLLGEIRLRPQLTEPFERHHGHIGYNVRPSARGNGYATRMLALALEKAREQGLPRVMLTIEGENPASERVIARNGGHLEWTRPTPDREEVLACYWIEL